MTTTAKCQLDADVTLQWRCLLHCSSYVTDEDCFEHNVGDVDCRDATSFGGKKLGLRHLLNRSV
jgi:hypothetical protein